HRAKDSVRKVLSHHCSRSQVSIVRNINQHVSAFSREGSGDRWISRLDANEDSCPYRSGRKKRILITGSEVADYRSYQRSSRHPTRYRDIFTKRQQPNLIILGDLSTFLIYKDC